MPCSSDGSYPNLETAQKFEICVVGGLSRSDLFSNEENSQMSKILKESGTRMQSMGADPSNVYNARTMLRLFAAALANLVHKSDIVPKTVERKQNYTAVLEICSESLPKTASTELTDEVIKILSSMENKKSHKNDNTSGKRENELDKQESLSDDKESKKRDKRSPQSNAGFQSSPPLDAVITGVLITTPSFGKIFKDGLSKQDALYYSKTIVEAALATNGYYNAINEALNEVTIAMSNLVFMPQTYDYASAIGNSINTALARQGLSNFANGVVIGNAIISKLEDITPKPSSDFSFPSSFDSVDSSSAWDSGISVKQPPSFQLNPSWDSPPAPAFEFDASPKLVEPKPFIDNNKRFPLNPSFNLNPVDPLPTFNFGSPNLPDFSSPSASFPFQEPGPAKRDYLRSPEPILDPFPADQFTQISSPFQPTGVSRDNSNPFRFDAPQINQQNFDLGVPQSSNIGKGTFIRPSYLQENISSSNFKDAPLSFDQIPIPGNSGQISNPLNEPARTEEYSFSSETISTGQAASEQPLETPDPYVLDVTTMIENMLGLSEDFSSNFDQNLSPGDAASIATAMTKLALSQYDPSIVSGVGYKIENAVYGMPSPSSTADYAHTIADTFIKEMQENGLLNSVNSKKMADSLIAGLKNEMSRRNKALTDAQTMVQTSSLQTEMPIEVSDAALSTNIRSQAVDEIFTNSDASLTYTSNIFPQDRTSSSAAASVRQPVSNLDFTVPLGPSASGIPSAQSRNNSSNQNVPTTTFSPLDVTEPMKLATILDILYTPFATTQATPTKGPYRAALTEAAKNQDTLFDFLMDQVNSSLKALNATPMPKTTQIANVIPVTTDASAASVVTVNNGPTGTAGQQPQASSQTIILQDAQPETAIESSTPDRYDEELSEFAQRVSAVATSTIKYIRSGKVNTDELCGKLNILAFMVEIPPVDNCTEIAMIDFLLNVMNSVIFTLRNR
ncbi:hypothetical protein JTE90_026558 [Oedothorax gibbosus]|uniref:Tubuliform egg casing silk strands structural domain-containing protein n=1 Tax=Oedothorax gibbosus TaxID=931172 RepID=A0AAV6U3B5_9ARAC|nr:hypothetical protein JTE90_026558 [Oedothorax gibbosus]